jgi:hypothetical protein
MGNRRKRQYPVFLHLNAAHECTEKNYPRGVGRDICGERALPASPHIPVLFSRLTFFSIFEEPGEKDILNSRIQSTELMNWSVSF